MAGDQHRTSRAFGAMQTLLLCGFTAIFFFAAGPRVFTSATASLAGAVLCAGGLALMLTAVVSLRAVIQVAPEPRPGGHLITRGVYGRLRHPIYTAIVILLIGLFLRKPAISIGIAAIAVIGFLMIKVRFEEQLLLARYPEYAGTGDAPGASFPGWGVPDPCSASTKVHRLKGAQHETRSAKNRPGPSDRPCRACRPGARCGRAGECGLDRTVPAIPDRRQPVLRRQQGARAVT